MSHGADPNVGAGQTRCRMISLSVSKKGPAKRRLNTENRQQVEGVMEIKDAKWRVPGKTKIAKRRDLSAAGRRRARGETG